jgi:arginyl-tRNA synthetase
MRAAVKVHDVCRLPMTQAPTLHQLLDARVSAALDAAGCPGAPPVITPAARPEFGDFQANGVMAAAKGRRRNPRELAQEVVEKLNLAGIASKVEIAGPGFINITLAPEFIAARVSAALGCENLGVPRPAPLRVVIDYSTATRRRTCSTPLPAVPRCCAMPAKPTPQPR